MKIDEAIQQIQVQIDSLEEGQQKDYFKATLDKLKNNETISVSDFIGGIKGDIAKDIPLDSLAEKEKQFKEIYGKWVKG